MAVLNTIEERPELCQAFGFMKDGSTVTVSSKGKNMDAHYDTLINEVVIHNNKQLGFTEANRKDLRPVFKNRVTACAFCSHLRMHHVIYFLFLDLQAQGWLLKMAQDDDSNGPRSC